MIVIFSPTAAGFHHRPLSQVLCHSSEVISRSKISIRSAERGEEKAGETSWKSVDMATWTWVWYIYKPQYHFNSIALQDFSSFLGPFSLVNYRPGLVHCQSCWGLCSWWQFINSPDKTVADFCAFCRVSPVLSVDMGHCYPTTKGRFSWQQKNYALCRLCHTSKGFLADLSPASVIDCTSFPYESHIIFLYLFILCTK